ncbi:FAD-dependent oxidoreductase [Thermoclostridium stercorarium subsp. leptospartum DSM 9219]|uniref:FAD-dependent oxidoreductase n=1 Tax=Thermoclostridium stercorarium subsp. leptospartum DSM 9219 TaxID=1346611 RepID=A0A1B1YMU0_THEST|nr:FAD-dependent oxidoreductase [Thermoclostridium stercorarium]ANX02036.1 FAD-dependent oxidoreductase [Thermoclostridium stercorarium subsp. leptospartum DSM 9219]
MKVAIVGAGLAGLACAHELERLGIVPDLYEKNGFIGEPFTHSTAMLRIVDRPPHGDYIRYFREKLYLDITPLAPIRRVMHHSPTRNLMVTGRKLGFFFLRSNTKDSIKNQIFASLNKTRVFLNNYADPHKLKKHYDYVVVATGNNYYPKEYGIWQTWFNGYIRGAIIHGNFDTSRIDMWINQHYCRNGYAYLTPFSEKKASVILVVSDCSEQDINEFWHTFLYYENIKYPIIEEFTQHHVSGHVYPKIIDNIIFAGLSGGSIDPFLGFGQFNSLSMGVFAARYIVLGLDYHKQCQYITKKNIYLQQLREGFNKLDNKGYDSLLAAMGIPGVRALLYKTTINWIPLGSSIIKKINKNQLRLG